MQPSWNVTGMPCKIDKKNLKLESTAALTKEFAASEKLDLMVGRNPVQLKPVDINIFALNTENFTETLVKCFFADKDVTDLESLCKKYKPEDIQKKSRNCQLDGQIEPFYAYVENKYSYTCRNTNAVNDCEGTNCTTKCDEVRSGLQLCQIFGECDPKSKNYNQNVANTILKLGNSVGKLLLI